VAFCLLHYSTNSNIENKILGNKPKEFTLAIQEHDMHCQTVSETSLMVHHHQMVMKIVTSSLKTY
jgi:hypothetical protein